MTGSVNDSLIGDTLMQFVVVNDMQLRGKFRQ